MQELRVFLGVVAVALAACGGTAVGGDSDDTSGGTTGETSGTTSSATTTGGGTTGGSTGGSTGGGQQCGPGSVDMDDPCEVCVLENCAPEALACCQQEGCLDIIACAQETGCSGIDCYTPETCQSAIDAAGGPTIATQYAQPLGECALTSCTEKCGGAGAGGGGM